MKKELKLYVWEGVLCDYTDGIMFALAESVEEARQAILESADGWAFPGSRIDADLRIEPKEYSSKVGFFLFGGA